MADNSGDGSNEEYNGIEWDDAYDPGSDFWKEHDRPSDSDKEWDGSGDTRKDNTWSASETTGGVRPEDETKEQRKARKKKERKEFWAEAVREAEVEHEQKKLKKEELARRAKEEREERAFQARAEAIRKGYKIEDWEVRREADDSPAAKKERKVAAALVAVGIAAGIVGGLIGHNTSPDPEIIVEEELRFIDTTPSVDTRANNRAQEILAERGSADPELLNYCNLAATRGVEVRNYLLASAPKTDIISDYINDLYAVATDPHVDIGVLNEARVGLEQLSNTTFSMTDRSQRMIRDFNYYAEKCGVQTDSEFSSTPTEPDLGYILDGNFEDGDIPFEDGDLIDEEGGN